MLGITTPCMGRLRHLMRTAPRMIRECNEYCLVDYSCPDNSGRWLQINYPDTHVVSFPGKQLFNKPIAHNAGVARLSELGCDIVCLCDADTMVNPGLGSLIISTVRPGHFLIANHHRDLTGFLAVTASDFANVGGFDLVSYTGWGCEDLDLRLSLYIAGFTFQVAPTNAMSAIEHSDTQRTAHYSTADKAESAATNLSTLSTKFHNLTHNPKWNHSLEVTVLLGGHIGDKRFSDSQFVGIPYPGQL